MSNRVAIVTGGTSGIGRATALALKEATRAGRRAEYSNTPAVSTSRAKKVAAMGVRNRPAKPAAMPVRSSCFPALGMGRRLPME